MFTIIPYEKGMKEKWDDFVLNQSCNGTFLQTMHFLDYHPEGRFEDVSFLVADEKGSTVAVVPACKVEEEGKSVFFSHKGSTFGGIVLSEKYHKTSSVLALMEDIEDYLVEQDYDKVVFKETPSLFSKVSVDLLEYCFFQRGFSHYVELSTYVDLQQCKEDILLHFHLNKRSRLRNSCSQNLSFRKVTSNEEIADFYEILQENLKKYQAVPIHTLEEILDFANVRLKDNTALYGVYKGEKMLAGSFVFFLSDTVAHTQNLVSLPEFAKENALMFLSYRLLVELRQEGFHKVSWGISTENCGKEVNLGLIRAKESYGSVYSNNRTYYKKLGDHN